jgi:hypothetical protein
VLASGQDSYAELAAQLPRDVEHDIWQALVAFRCQDFFSSYVTVHGAPPVHSCMPACPALARCGAPGQHPPSPAQEAGAHGAPAMGLQGFHPQNEGVNFRQAYRWGLTGDYERFTQVTRALPLLLPGLRNHRPHTRAVVSRLTSGMGYSTSRTPG